MYRNYFLLTYLLSKHAISQQIIISHLKKLKTVCIHNSWISRVFVFCPNISWIIQKHYEKLQMGPKVHRLIVTSTTSLRMNSVLDQ
jgi:hypothetical protein